ncbi:hypothetical protein [Phenylobacterium sp. J367]|uniref:hypothetical protein n=1 Tax=Phenylobacterium sp. J367 TaxID=2898435 RepID=UPI0021512F9C|nr:hypothetical protein [Phenylobacterium sp. J367]MCR5877312.1 hypothetical protein [Phenylobacterium sp. J367]
MFMAMLLLALCAVVSLQRAQAAVNDVQHGLAIAHADPAIEKATVANDPHDHHHDADHDHDDPAAEADGDDDRSLGSHHHHAEGPQVASLPTPVLEHMVASHAERPLVASDRGAPPTLTYGVERPPKSRSADRA